MKNHLYFMANPISAKAKKPSSQVKDQNTLSQSDCRIFKLYYFKKKVRDQIDFLYQNEYHSFLWADTVLSGGHSQAFLKVLKTRNLQYLCNISRKKGGMKLNFHQHHTFRQVDTINFGYCQSCPKIPKITSS